MRAQAPRVMTTLVLALVAFTARLAFGLWAKLPPAWDGVLYERAARGIARGLGYSCFMFGEGSDPHVLTAYYPVGYPAFLGALYAVFGAEPWVLVASGSLVGALTVALTHRLALRVASPRSAALASLTLALMPGQVMFSVTPMTEGSWGFCLTLAVYSLGRTENLRARDFALCALSLAAATFVRPQALLLAPVLAWVPRAAPRVRLLRASAVTLMVLLAIAPWSARNYRALGGFALVSTNGGSNLAIGAAPEARGMYFILGDQSGCRENHNEVSRDRCWRDWAVVQIRRDPARWIALVGPKVWHTMGYEVFALRYALRAREDFMAEGHRVQVQRAMSAPWRAMYLLCIVALLPLYPRKSNGRVGALSLAAIVTVLATHAVFFGGDRYHLPIGSFVAVLAATALRGKGPRIYGALSLRPLGPRSSLRGVAQDPCKTAENSGPRGRGG